LDSSPEANRYTRIKTNTAHTTTTPTTSNVANVGTGVLLQSSFRGMKLKFRPGNRVP
jgi:hypothetical protein